MKRRKRPTEIPLKKAFGSRLREIRERRGLSQKQLAEMLKTDVMQISRYERGLGLPSLETCVELASILRISSDELLLGRETREGSIPISDVRLLDRFVESEKLPRQDREAIILLIDGVLAQRHMEAELEKRRRA